MEITKQQLDSALTVISGAATAAITYAIWRNPIVLMGASVLAAHEFGHYFSAKEAGAEVKPPIFIPAIITMIGGTYTKDIPEASKSDVALAGVKNGLLASGLTLAISRLLGQSSMLAPIIGIGVNEVLSAVLGSDGKRYRAAKRSLDDSDTVTAG